MTSTLAQAAARYADLGLEVFPLNANKAPANSNGMNGATSDPEQVADWWTAQPDALIGCRIPVGFVVLDLDPRHGALDVWAALEAEHGPIATRTHWSGRGDGGRHLWLRLPDDHGKPSVKRLDQWACDRGLGVEHGRRWVSGIDLLHHGHRYTILPPSPHPSTGEPYRWGDPATGPTAEIADAPDWLVDLLTRPEPPPPDLTPIDPWNSRATDSVADWYSDTHTWSALLHRHGWTLAKGDGESDGSAWRHPLATSDVSATIRHRCLFVFTPNTPFEVTEPDDPQGQTLFRAWATLEHGGDLTAAAREARRLRGDPDPQDLIDAWMAGLPLVTAPTLDEVVKAETQGEEAQAPPTLNPIRVADYAHDRPAPAPAIWADMISEGEFSVLAAERNLGKSWFMMALAWSLASGTPFLGRDVPTPRRVLYLSGEAGPSALAGRWHMLSGLGASPYPAALWETSERFRIRIVTERIQAADGVLESKRAIIDPHLLATIDTTEAEVVILDPWAVYFHGSENSNDEVEAALARLNDVSTATGATFVLVHHFGKGNDVRQPEDLWRGASRLADWAANRLTLTFSLAKSKADDMGLSRREARRWARLTTLRRNDIAPDDIELYRGDDMWWTPTTAPGRRPGEERGARPGGLDGRILEHLETGAIVRSSRAGSELFECAPQTFDEAVNRLVNLGWANTWPGERGARAVVLNGSRDDDLS